MQEICVHSSLFFFFCSGFVCLFFGALGSNSGLCICLASSLPPRLAYYKSSGHYLQCQIRCECSVDNCHSGLYRIGTRKKSTCIQNRGGFAAHIWICSLSTPWTWSRRLQRVIFDPHSLGPFLRAWWYQAWHLYPGDEASVVMDICSPQLMGIQRL